MKPRFEFGQDKREKLCNDADADDDVDLAYPTLARLGNRSEHIVELDGGREGPLDRGKTTGETFLEVSPGRSCFWSSTFVALSSSSLARYLHHTCST
jgi:hypothetical protein